MQRIAKMSDVNYGSDDFAVRVSDVSKIYGLWSSPNARLQHVLLEMARGMVPDDSWIAERVRKKIASIYREFKALETISFDIKKGESWGFIGVNGSGKSTLLKMISGNLRPSTGRIEVDGRVATLDYTSGLHGDFTGRENIYLKASVLGMTRREIEAKLESIIEFADIGEFIDQPVKIYSSGMTARLGFAIVAHADADIIITDEALAVGDAFFVQKCMERVRDFLKRGTFLFVSHSTNDVISLCNKAVWLEEGHIRQIGDAKDVTEAYLSSRRKTRSQRYLERQYEEIEQAAADREQNELLRSPLRGVELTQPALAQATNARPTRIIRDGRTAFLNATQYRNDIEVLMRFEHDGAGVGGATILEVTLEDLDGAVLSWIVGGEMARLRIVAKSEREIAMPIIGFQVKDHLGQSLFADNTSVLTIETPFLVGPGGQFEAEFEFQMPLLPVGEYVVTASVVEGEESNNALLARIGAAIVLRSVSSGSRHGLVGVPMHRIRIGLATGARSPHPAL